MPIAQDARPLQSSNADLNNPAKLRSRMQEDGYLYFRGLGPKEKILNLRRAMLTICAEAGWVETQKHDLMEGKWSGAGPFGEGDPEYMAVYKKVVNHPTFNSLPEDHFFFDIVGKLVGGPVMMHRMHIGRVSFPQNTSQTTPAHQDWQYIRGTPDTYTIWTPVGDTPLEVGGIKVLRGSHKHGFREHSLNKEHKFAGMGLTPPDLDETGGDEWHTAAYGLGDCVIFHSHTVHGAMPNVTPDTLRLSVDNRYQKQGDEFGSAATMTHHNL